MDSAYAATSSPSPYAYTSSSLYAPSLNPSPVSSPSEDASSSVLSDDQMADLPPASLDQDWDSLSEILINDALCSLPPSSVIDLGHEVEFMTQDTINDPPFPQSEATPSSPFLGALPIDSNCSKSSFVGVEDEPVRVDVVPPTLVVQSPAVKKGGRGRGRGKKAVPTTTTTPQKSAGSPEEQKKERRRSQIATGVQRHREKKKWLVSSLQTEMTQLTTKLATLRAARRAQLANSDELVAYEEEAMTQRRKRKQAEQHNQMLKHALFQQTMFLGGMKAMMGGSNLLLSKTLEFHDWVHSYTALSASDPLARRKEYVAHFPRSKMELAKNIVLRNMEDKAQRLLATRQMFSGSVRILHDGTRQAHEIEDDYADAMMRELFGRPNGSSTASSSSNVDDAGDGRVIKEFSSVCYFPETAKCNLYTLMDIVSNSMKSIGVYYSGVCYEAQAADEVHLVEDDGLTTSSVYYSNLAASMEPVVEVIDEADCAENIVVEARALTRVQCGQDEGIFLWDYADEDSLYPIPTDSPDRKAIRRDVCGAIVVRREIGTGLLSIRHISVKAYRPLAKPKNLTEAVESSEAEEIRRAVARQIGLQATEFERLQDRCMRFVFNDITSRLKALYL